MIRLLFLLLATGIPAVVFAWSGYNNVTITYASLLQAGQASPPGALIRVTPYTPADTEGCSSSGTGYVWIDWSSSVQPDGKAVYSALLAAELAGKTVNVGVNGCSSSGYPVVYGIVVYP